LCFCGSPPFWSYYFWLSGAVGTLVILKVKKGRLGLFQTYKDLLGNNGQSKHWWAMSGIMTWAFQDVFETLKNFQERGPYFGNNKAARPGIWPPGVDQPGTGGSFFLWISGDKHTSLRRAVHHQIIGKFDLIKERYRYLQGYLTPYVPSVPKDPAEFLSIVTNQPDKITELVSRTVWLIAFGVELTPEELGWAAEWGSSAAFFILPQFIQNVALRLLEKRVTTMRRNMVTIMCRRPAVVQLFKELRELMNTTNQGGQNYSGGDVEILMDEVQFVVNFAGLLGTMQLLQSTVYALNRLPNPEYVRDDQINFPETLKNKKGQNVTYVEAYNEDPIAFIKEVARIDPPVTSANSLTTKPMSIDMPKACCCGGKVDVPVGTGNQYLISLANRDETQFPNPMEFNPYRANNHNVLSWNGTFPFPEEVKSVQSYDPMGAPTYDPNGSVTDRLPLSQAQRDNWNRVCPGRNIALETVTMLLGICPALNKSNLSIKWKN
jgi:cytochrome P450